MFTSIRLLLMLLSVTCSKAYADPVPHFIGKLISEAGTLAYEVNMNLVVEKVDSLERRGLVLLQIPEVGSEVSSGRQIYVRVSNGMPVPNMKGRTRAEAEATLDRLGIGHEVSERRHDGLVRGTVAAQTPVAGERMDASLEVVFLDLVGGRYVLVPDVRGKPLSEALLMIKNSELEGTENPVNADLAKDSHSWRIPTYLGRNIENATAGDSNPPADTEVYPGTNIQLFYNTEITFIPCKGCHWVDE